MKFDLSYVIATYNRFPFLKITLGKLIEELKPDEEIVVVDGNSTDGTKGYLEQLFKEGKIHQFISEPDRNQAHAWNKAMLMARGTIIKKIIDDDVFCYPAIRKCRDFMIQNPNVDVVISNDLYGSLEDYNEVRTASRLSRFEKWKNGLAPSFTFGDVHMLIRRRSLALIGIYNPAYVMMDWEYSLRISYLKANIAYYTGYNALSVAHPQTVTSLQNEKLVKEQSTRACIFYEYESDTAWMSNWSKIKIAAGKLLKPGQDLKKDLPGLSGEDIVAAYKFFYDSLSDMNNSESFLFLTTN